MKHITRWRPDTCGCELEYEWDDTENENVRTHSISKVLKACPAHGGFVDKKNHYDAVLDENRRKNIVFGEIIKGAAGEDIIQEDGTMVRKLKRGKEYKWSFDENRNLVIDLVGFTSNEKTAVRSISDNLFPNKTRII